MAVYKNKKKTLGTTVYVIDNDINRAISMVRHICAPIIKEYKEKRYFEKPSDKRRRKAKESIRKLKRKLHFREF